MRYTISINQVKTREWGLNMNEGALMDLINQAYSWAEPVMIDGSLYYWMSRNKVIAEIPTAYSKPDTVYRAFRTLAQKGLVLYTKQGKRDLLALTAKGKKWNVEGTTIGDAMLGNKSDLKGNSEIDPSKFGNKSENNSDRNPTNKNTSIYKSISNKNTKASKFKPIKPESVSEQVWNDLLILRKETKASNSQTAWTTVFNGLAKAQQATGHSLDQIITFWIGKAWKGFNADWYLNAQPKPQPTKTYQGNNNANHQSANSQYQPKQSQADIYAAKLAEQRRQRDQAANTAATGCDRANVYDMETPI